MTHFLVSLDQLRAEIRVGGSERSYAFLDSQALKPLLQVQGASWDGLIVVNFLLFFAARLLQTEKGSLHF